MVDFSHITDSRAQMVDITLKEDVTREATAKGRIYLRKETILAIQEGAVIKGNVLATARIAVYPCGKRHPPDYPDVPPDPHWCDSGRIQRRRNVD